MQIELFGKMYLGLYTACDADDIIERDFGGVACAEAGIGDFRTEGREICTCLNAEPCLLFLRKTNCGNGKHGKDYTKFLHKQQVFVRCGHRGTIRYFIVCVRY